MEKFTTKIDLMKIPGAVLIPLGTADGSAVECLCIPVNNGYLFNGEKGVYMNTVTTERRSPSYGWTHSVKISATTEFYKTLTDEQRKAIPFIGDAKPMESGGSATPATHIPQLNPSKPKF